MPVEHVSHAPQLVPRPWPKQIAPLRPLWLLLRFDDGAEQWYAVEDVHFVREQYDVVGHARRV